MLVSALVWCFDRGSLSLSAFFKGSRASLFQVIYYHGVEEDELEEFCWQLDYLVRTKSAVGLADIGGARSHNQCVVVSFDDALSATMQRILPEVVSREVPIVVFVPSGYLGRRPDWRMHPEDYAARDNVVSQNALIDLAKCPLVELGSHGRYHIDIGGLAEAAARTEFSCSREMLERIVGKRIQAFSFPYGAFRQEQIEYGIQAGYRWIFTTVPEQCNVDIGFGACGRVRVDPSDWRVEYGLKLSGAYRWLAHAGKIKAWARG